MRLRNGQEPSDNREAACEILRGIRRALAHGIPA